MMELNINEDASIDRFNLEKEATKLPSVIARYQDAILEQTRLVDNLKIKKEKEEAVARQDARRALANEGKPTQAMVDDAVSCLPAIIRLRKEVAEEERELAYLKSCISILEVKRRSLDNLVSLYIKAYYDMHPENGDYTEADVKRRASSNYDSMADAETERLNAAINRR